MLNVTETESLLSKLCVKLGFCLPPEADALLIEAPPNTVDEFTDAVFLAEGLNPRYVDRRLYRQVREEVAEAFQKHLDNNFINLENA